MLARSAVKATYAPIQAPLPPAAHLAGADINGGDPRDIKPMVVR